MTSSDYEQQADAAERELADMEQRAGKLGDHVDEARKDWEAKKADPAVPGAGGDPDRAEEGGRHPETAVTAPGPEDDATSEDQADNDRGVDDTP
jgi:multidrug resistance efflux pump